MIDKNGKVLEEGMQVWFDVGGSPRAGTIRNILMVDETYMAWVDDGDPLITDPRRNRLSVRRRLTGDALEVIAASSPTPPTPAAPSPAPSAAPWEPVGVVSVDSGMIWLGDPCYVLHTKKPKAVGKSWGDFAKILDRSTDAEQIPHNNGNPGLGVVVQSGFGDGQYPVEVRRLADGTIAEVRVVFISEK